MMKRVLSLDASTKTVGIAVIDYEGNDKKLIHYDFYHPNKKAPQLQMLSETKDVIKALLKNFSPDDLAIEEYISFMKGGSTAQTTIPLAIFNRTICLTAYEEMRKLPTIMHVSTVRSLIKKNNETPSKSDIPELVAEHLNISFPYYTRTIKKTGTNKILSVSYDVADAIAVGLAFIKKQSLPPKKQRKTK